MGTRPRLPNNVIWSLEDALGLMNDVWAEVGRLGVRAEKLEDPKLLGPLNRVQAALRDVECDLRNARAGKYEPKGGNHGGTLLGGCAGGARGER